MSIQKTVLKVDGMSCAACSSRIEKSLSSQEGIESVDAVFSSGSVSITYNEETISLDKIKKILAKTGYPVSEKLSQDGGWNLRNIIISAILTTILTIYAMGPMFGLEVPFYHEPVLYSLIQFILATPVLILGRRFYLKGIPALIEKSPTMDTLVSLGSGSAYLYSCYIMISAILGSETVSGICFDSAAMIVTLISVGKYLEYRSRIKADDAVSKLLTLIPDEANILKNNEIITIKVTELQKKDTVVIKPGERIPADGYVIYGTTSVDESMLTGESIPVLKKENDYVYTGTVNIDGSIGFVVTNTGGDTMLSEIVNLLEEAKSTKAPVARMADKVASYFVPAVISIALISCICWLISGRTLEFSLNVLISILVISCPCALGLATPLAITVGSGKAAQHGILFRNAAALEMCGKINYVVMDKTGTLTKGQLKVEKYDGDKSILPGIMTAEEMSEHPIGNAIVSFCKELNVEPKEISDFEYVVGRGISFTYNEKRVTVGSPALHEGLSDDTDGFTTVYVSINDKIVGKFLLNDDIREESLKIRDILDKRNVSISMLSGDSAAAVKRVAVACNIEDYTFNALPEDKLTVVKRLQSYENNVMMIGDGINDSPALAQADVGVAMGSGTDIALGSSDVVLMNDDLYNVPRMIDYGKKTLKNIKENLFLAFCYNLICIPIAAGLPYVLGMGEISHMPMIAAAAMSLSSLSVVTNALRLRRFDPKY